MDDFEIIDSHVHLHRSLAIEKECCPVPGRRDRDRWGNPDSIIHSLDRAGISRVLCVVPLPTASLNKFAAFRAQSTNLQKKSGPAKGQAETDILTELKRDNEWLCQVSQNNPRISVGIGIQNLFTPEEMVEELELRLSQGAKVVKLLPGFYSHFPNDHAFWPMYKRCEELGIPVMSDTGTLTAAGPSTASISKVYYGEPIHFAEVLESFPRLTVVMCHLGSAFWDERLEMAQRYSNLCFDISPGFNSPGEIATAAPLIPRDGCRTICEEDAPRIMRKVGVERIIFGTDGPRRMAQPAIEQVLRMDLTDNEKHLILAENAKRIYKI
jgi:uncharacterized protein